MILKINSGYGIDNYILSMDVCMHLLKVVFICNDTSWVTLGLQKSTVLNLLYFKQLLY